MWFLVLKFFRSFEKPWKSIETSMQNKIYYLMPILILASFSVWAGEHEPGPLELEDVLELSLRGLMDIDVSIATKYKLPISKARGKSKGLKGEDLGKRGIRTVGEAMDHVPGMNCSQTMNG